MRGPRALALACFLAAATILGGPASAQGESLPDQVTDTLHARLETAKVDGRLEIAGQSEQPSSELLRFYEDRAFRPAWSDEHGLLPAAKDLLAVLSDATSDGLQPRSYRISSLKSAVRDLPPVGEGYPAQLPVRLADLDILLTDAFLRYARHMLRGRVRPETLPDESPTVPGGEDTAHILAGALASGQIAQSLAALRPSEPGYARLRAALADYRALAAGGGYPVVPDGPKLHEGDHDRRVTKLRQRLRLSGDLTSGHVPDPALFDADLARAVRHFQGRHGLLADGIVGAATTRALDVPAADRARQIELNLERWRWLPRNIGERYIRVNIPAFELEVVDAGKPVMAMKVIVGKPYLSTPLFTAKMTNLVLNPYWTVPRSIATKELLPTLRKEPDYLAREGIRVFEGRGPERHEVDPEEIDWNGVTRNYFPYRLRQEPGPKNPLGRIKFMFPNTFDVYLHDTPSRQLFARPVRGFSHGCIRIEKAFDLAAYLLKDDPRWDRDKLSDAIDFGRRRWVALPHPIAVEIVYLTAWVDQDGTVHFRDDIYGRDRDLAEALAQKGY